MDIFDKDVIMKNVSNYLKENYYFGSKKLYKGLMIDVDKNSEFEIIDIDDKIYEFCGYKYNNRSFVILYKFGMKDIILYMYGECGGDVPYHKFYKVCSEKCDVMYWLREQMYKRYLYFRDPIRKYYYFKRGEWDGEHMEYIDGLLKGIVGCTLMDEWWRSMRWLWVGHYKGEIIVGKDVLNIIGGMLYKMLMSGHYVKK